MRTIENVLAECTIEWMKIPAVLGTAIGELDGQRCIKVLIVERANELALLLPTEVEGYRVVIEETGRFRAL